MELQSRDALPPFLAAVRRRRHPDLDAVLLPPEQAELGRAVSVTEQQLANVFDLTTGTATRLWAEAVGDGQVPDTRFALGPDEASVVARSRVSARLDGSPLVPLAAALAEGAWDVGRPPGAATRLLARRHSTHLVASYAGAGGTFELTLTSPPFPVGVDRARELARR
jgi:hypothetical protein